MSSFPLLSPNFSTGMSSFSSRLTNRLQHLGMKDVDLASFCNLRGIALMVCKWVMRIVNPDLRVGLSAHFVPYLKRANARHIGLEGQDLQIEHQFYVLGVRRQSNSDRRAVLLRDGIHVIPLQS